MSATVPKPVFTAAGVSVPAESDIIAGLVAVFQAAFGNALNSSPATPQGQLITMLGAAFGASNDLLLEFVNQVDPAFADGRMQDAIARFYYLTRKGALPTTVACVCTGAAGTVIPAGALAQAADGTIYQSLGQVTIPPAGTISISFAAIDLGPIPCPAGTLTTIYRLVSGWDSITNPSDGVIGRDSETRAAFEARRQQSVAINATGHLPAIRAALLNVDGVIDAYVTENSTSAAVTIGSVTIAANSIYAAVYGGTDADVARALWVRKAPGCGYTGDTTVTVKDTSSGYDTPYPAYDVTFKRPAALPIFIAVQIADNGLVPADAQDQIRAVVAAAFVGADGGTRPRIGGTIYGLRFVAGIQALGSWAQVVTITIGTASAPTAADVVIPIDQMPTLDIAHVSVSLV